MVKKTEARLKQRFSVLFEDIQRKGINNETTRKVIFHIKRIRRTRVLRKTEVARAPERRGTSGKVQTPNEMGDLIIKPNAVSCRERQTMLLYTIAGRHLRRVPAGAGIASSSRQGERFVFRSSSLPHQFSQYGIDATLSHMGFYRTSRAKAVFVVTFKFNQPDWRCRDMKKRLVPSTALLGNSSNLSPAPLSSAS